MGGGGGGRASFFSDGNDRAGPPFRPPPPLPLQTLLATPPTAKATPAETRERTALARSALLRAAGDWITPAGRAARVAFFAAPATGVFATPPASRPAHETMMTNPDAVTGMLKQSLSGIVPQIAMGAFSSYFFSGFVLGRVPFPLSPSFRLMLQRGLDLPALDVTYMTALSFYILLLFGLRGAFLLAFREGVVDEVAAQRAAMGMGGGGPMGPGPPDPAKAFEGEKAALALLDGPPRTDRAEAAAADALRACLARPAGRRAR